MLSYYLYARKSSEDSDNQILSIDSQIKELTDYAKKYNLSIEKIFTESKSAKKLGRPVFNQLMEALWKTNDKGILCWKLDRLARNPVDGGSLIHSLEEGKIANIVTPNQTYRNNGNDKFWMQLEFGMAKKYVDDLSDNVKRGLRAKLEQGWFPGLAPLGYLNEKYQDKGRRKILKDPERFSLVRKMWDLMLVGNYSVTQILEIANNQWALRTGKSGGRENKPLWKSGIYRMLTNPFYCGLFKYKGQLYQGKHESIVTVDEFDKVQILLGRKGKPRPKKHEFPFTGLIKCEECGCSITAEEKTKLIRATGQVKKYIYYHCTKKKNPNCLQGSVEAQQLEHQIQEFLQKIQLPSEYVKWALKYLGIVREKDKKKGESITENLQKRLQILGRQLENLLSLKISAGNSDGSLLSDEEFANQKNRLLKEKTKLEQELSKKQGTEEKVYQFTKETLLFSSYALFWFTNGKPEQKRKIFAALGSNYTLKDKKLVIQAKKPLALIEEGLNRLGGDNERLEPKELSFVNRKGEAVASLVPILCTLVDDVRTEIMESKEKIGFPKFPLSTQAVV